MSNDELLALLQKVDHSKERRQQMSDLIIGNPVLISELLSIAHSGKKKIASKACWVIEYVARQDLSCIYSEIDQFISVIPSIKGESAIRPMAKICELLVLEHYSKDSLANSHRLNKDQLEQIATVCFDWLIGPHKVAAKAFSMTSLYYLGKSFSWIHAELRMVLEQNYPNESAAYKARARHVLALLNN